MNLHMFKYDHDNYRFHCEPDLFFIEGSFDIEKDTFYVPRLSEVADNIPVFDGLVQPEMLEAFREALRSEFFDNKYSALNKNRTANARAQYKKHPYKGWSEEAKKMHLAKKSVRYAVKTGKIVKPSNCSACGKEGKLHGHHPNYNERLKVIWLCATCHLRLHKVKDENFFNE